MNTDLLPPNFPWAPISGVAALLYLFLKTVEIAMPSMSKSSLYNRVLPVLPELLGVLAFIAVPSFSPAGSPWGWKVLFGVSAGLASSKVHKIIEQTVLGKDVLIRAAKKSTPPAIGEDTEKKSS